MTIDKVQLRALTEKTTPACEWYKPGDLRYADDKTGEIHGLHHDDDSFIAAANPATVLALLDEIERLEKDGTAMLFEATMKAVAEQRDRLKAENESLRQIISESATACGAAVSVECSLEFMGMLPGEISSVVGRLRSENEVLKSQVQTLQAEPNSYQSGHDAGRRCSASYAQSHRNEALAVSAKNVELHAENEALRKDAERFRWLMNLDEESAADYVGYACPGVARCAIDGAMAKEAGHD